MKIKLIGLALFALLFQYHITQSQSPTRIIEIAWHPGGSYIAVAQADGIYIYNTDYQQVTLYKGRIVEELQLSWNSDGTQLAVIGTNINIFNFNAQAASLDRVTTIERPIETSLPAGDWNPGDDLSRQMQIAAASSNIAQIWNTQTGTLITELETNIKGAISVLEWHPEGQRLAGAIYFNPNLVLWDTSTSNIIATLPQAAAIDQITWSPDGTQIAVATDNNIAIWDANTYQLIKNLPVSMEEVSTLEVSSMDWGINGLAVFSFETILTVWDVEAGEPIETIYTKILGGKLAWSPDGEHLLWGGNNQLNPIQSPLQHRVFPRQ